jgi:hypothetical protein
MICASHSLTISYHSSRIGSAYRGVAQPGSALGLGPRGRWFESNRPDSLKAKSKKAKGKSESLNFCLFTFTLPSFFFAPVAQSDRAPAF